MFDIKPTLFTGKCFFDLPTIESTNIYALNLLKKTNIAEGTVVSTFNQTKGKGNANNSWLSEAGKNLSFSIIYKPAFLLARQQFYLNMAICLGIIDAFETEIKLNIKWPNDIYYKKYKVGGLLIENTLTGKNIKNSVIGIGINVNQLIFNDALPNPISLKLINGKAYDLYKLLSKVLAHIEKRYLQLRAVQFEALKKAYLRNLFLYEKSAMFLVDGRQLAGTIKGVDDTGQLLIEIGNKLRAFGFKEVGFVL